jgi:hypothetical protein
MPMNLRRSLFRAKIENEPSSNPITTRSVPLSPSDASIAMDIGSRGVSASPNSSVDAINSRSFFELHALRPDIESAAYTILFDIITSSGGSGGLSATTISLTAHCPCVQLWRNR